MLAFLRLVADFSRGCAGKRIGQLLFATHPALAFANAQWPTQARQPAPVGIMSDVESEDVRWLWDRRIPLGKLTLLEGDLDWERAYYDGPGY
jgi:hypothetical protein